MADLTCFSIQPLRGGYEPCAWLQVCKVYIGSFNADKPVRSDLNPAGVELFEKEQSDLLQDLYDIPQRACDRKVEDAPLSPDVTRIMALA